MEPVQTLVRATARLYQRLSAYIILLGAFVCLLYFLVYFTLNSSFAISAFDVLVNENLKGKVSWSRISWGPLPWRIKILEPVLRDAEGQAVVTAQTVSVGDFRLLELLKGNIAADDITIEKPVVRIVGTEPTPAQQLKGQTGTIYNISEMFEPKTPIYQTGMPPREQILAFNEVNIRNAAFVLDLNDQAIIAHGINVADARFDIRMMSTGDYMTIGARHVDFSHGEVKVNLSAQKTRALVNDGPDCLRFPVTDTAVRDFNWFGDKFKVARLLGKIRGDTISVERFRIDLESPATELGGLVRLSIPKVEKHLAPLGIKMVQGAVSLQIDGYGEPEAFAGKLELISPQLTIEGITVSAIDLSARQNEDGQITISDLNAHYEGGRISGHGGYDLESERGWADLWIDALDWSRMPIDVNNHLRHALGGGARGFVHMRIQEAFGDSPNANAAIDVSVKRNFPNRFGLGESIDVNASIELEDDEVTVHRILVDGGGDQVSLSGFYDVFTTETDVSGIVRVNALSPVTREFGQSVQGRINARWRIDGRASNPRLWARLDGKRLGYSTLPKFDAVGSVTLLNGILELDRLTLMSKSGRIGAKGTVNLFAPNLPIDMQLDARQFDLNILPVDLAGITGRLALDARVKGSVKKPKIKGRLRLGKPCWRPPGKKDPLCFRRLDTVGEWAGDRFKLDKFVLRDRRHALVRINGSGRLKTKVFNGHIEIDDAPVSLINQIITEPLPIGGRVSIDVETSGTLIAPEGRGTIEIKQGRYADYDLGDAKLSIKANTQETRVQGQILNGMGLVAVIPTDGKSQIAEAALSFEGLRVEKWISELASLPIKTALTGEAITRFNPYSAQLEGVEVRLSGLQAAYRIDEKVEYLISARETSTVRFDGERIVVEQLDVGLKLAQSAATSTGTTSALRVRGDVTTKGALNFNFSGGVDLKLFHPYLTETFSEYTGRVKIDGRLKGYGADIRPYANLTIESGDFVPRSAIIGSQLTLIKPVTFELMPSIGPPPLASDGITPLTGIMEFRLKPVPEKKEKNVVRLLRDEHKFHVDEVHLHFEEFIPRTYKIAVSASDMVIAVPRTVRATINTPRLVFDMWEHEVDDFPPERRMRLSGDLQVLRGEYTKDVTGLQELNQDLRNSLTSRAETGEVSLFERVPALKRLMLDLSVTGDGGFFVRNQVAVLKTNLELRIDLKEVKGFIYAMPEDSEEERLRITGDVSLLPESKLTYARREFEVSNGRVDFGGLNFVEANVTATRTFSLQRGGASSGLSSSFDTGGAGVRLEEVVLSAKLVLPTIETQPQFDFQLSSKGGASPFEVAMLVLTGSYPEDLSGAASAQPATEVLLAPLLSLVERPLEDTLKVDLALTPDSQGSLVIDANKILSRRLRLYSRVLVGDDSDSRQQQIGLEYQINNVTFGELSSERTSSLVTTTGRLRLKLNLN